MGEMKSSTLIAPFVLILALSICSNLAEACIKPKPPPDGSTTPTPSPPPSVSTDSTPAIFPTTPPLTTNNPNPSDGTDSTPTLFPTSPSLTPTGNLTTNNPNREPVNSTANPNSNMTEGPMPQPIMP